MTTMTEQDPDAIVAEAPLAGEPGTMDVDNPETDATETDNPEADPSPAIDAAGVMMRADYQRKTAELAREREAMRAEQERLRYLAEYEEILRQNPEAAAHVQQMLEGRREAADPATLRELSLVKGQIAQMQQEQFFGALNSTAARVAQQFGMSTKEMVDVVTDEWNDKTIQIGMDPAALEKRLTKAAKAAGYDKARSGGEADLAQRLKDKAKAASPRMARTAAPESPEPDTSKMTDSERVAYMVKLANRKAR